MIAALDSRGMTLIEVLVALFLITICLLGAVPMFVYALQGNAVGADLGTVGALALERMELLRTVDYDDMVVGGNLSGNVADYFDDSHSGFVVRWQIADNTFPANTRTVTVRAAALRTSQGPRGTVTLTTLMGR